MLYDSVSLMAISGNVSGQALDRRKLADDRASAEARLRALDAMLGGVAHDLNNALSVVLMNLDVMQQDTALVAKHQRRMEGMFDAMTKASTLVRHLLSFSHSRRPEPEVVSIAEILESLIELLRVAVGKEVEITLVSRGAPEPCCVIVDPATFEVGLTHAVLQLAATMRGGGRLTLDLDKNEADHHVVLTVEAHSRSPDPRQDGTDKMDIALLEHLARDARGRVTLASADSAFRRLTIHLPACSETTVA